ncbi:DUF7224 domain-containing protein [Streptomyces sp. NEAU-Y11]|uniref:DUF7224 domain-containing protein n=1 Tax=Streptomyces cucumeris TaxID=2962890 RepID=UPI0020C9107E|nr:hypothetical protein [Streptomyces sp. NEAU-Y11]MCP9210969.1 hypothetical protein [Streptomyces sp. NEAU-Y11]
MKIFTSLRSSSAMWAAPVVIALTLFYYFVGGGAPDGENFGYAPTITSQALGPTYAFAYAAASGLAAWESGRLRKVGIWDLSPVRSRYRIAANALLPVLAVSWVMLLLPVTLALVETGVTPTSGSLYPLFMGMTLCAAHLVIGFGVGFWVPQLFAAPTLAALVFYLVAFSVTTTSYWMRHVSGQLIESVDFGELIPVSSLVPPLLFTGGTALGFAALWLPLRSSLLKATLACTLAAVGVIGGRSVVTGWDANTPVTAGNAPMRCEGKAPRVCMPEATASNIETVRKDVIAVLGDLRQVGLKASPATVTDRLTDGRSYRPSSRSVWRVQLSLGARDGNVRYRTLKAVVGFPCSRPDPATARAVKLWAAKVTGEEEEYQREIAARQEDFDSSPARVAAVRKEVDKVLAMPKKNQATWYRQSVTTACGKRT